jgi:hypothetical protein
LRGWKRCQSFLSRSQAAEAKEIARRKLLETGALHPADGPEVRHVCAVAADVIAITLQAGRHVSNQLVPYVAEPGDELVEVEKDQARHTVIDGRIVDYYPKALYRTLNGERTRVGLLSADGKLIFVEGVSSGQLLEETVVDLPAAYTIQSADDPAYAQPIAPAAVFRKGKPDGLSQPFPFRYTISWSGERPGETLYREAVTSRSPGSTRFAAHPGLPVPNLPTPHGLVLLFVSQGGAAAPPMSGLRSAAASR